MAASTLIGTSRCILLSTRLNNSLCAAVIRTSSLLPDRRWHASSKSLSFSPNPSRNSLSTPDFFSTHKHKFHDAIQLFPVSRLYSTQPEPEKKPTLIQRFKQMYRDYWYVLVPVHAVTSLAWFGGFYYCLQSGVDVVAVLESWKVSEVVLNPLRESKAGYLAISYALYKIFTPLRYTVTLGGTTLSINYLQKWGYIKPMPSRDKLKEMYQERKENLLERRDNIKAELKERKDHIIESVRETAEELKHKAEHLEKASALAESEKREAKRRRKGIVSERKGEK